MQRNSLEAELLKLADLNMPPVTAVPREVLIPETLVTELRHYGSNKKKTAKRRVGND